MSNDASSILDGLNDRQKLAVTTTDGPLLVVAGPGTGKTLTIVRRIAWLIHRGVRPESILAVTFTNRAAREMRERTTALLNRDAAAVFIGTFHLFGLSIIRQHHLHDPVIYSREEQIALLRSLMKGSARDGKNTAERISRIKNFQDRLDEELTPLYDSYQSALRQRNALDFDDLITIPVSVLENDDLAQSYRDRFSHIIIDEYQDINPAQYRLLRKLSHRSSNVCAVGDSDQAIYAFRGADLGNFLNFEHDFPNAARITLTENYRSVDTILRAADGVIRNNSRRIEKELVPVRGRGAAITILSVQDERAEAAAVVSEIEARMGGTSHHQMRQSRKGPDTGLAASRFGDFAVIFRTNGQAKVLEDAFSASGIPYQVIGRRSSVQAKELEETMAYLRSFLSGEGEMPEPPPSGSPEDRLLSPADIFDPRADAVTLMTLHMAKGLEFPVVFIAGVEEGLLPCTIMQDDIDVEEERRLFYVGMTRARDELLLVHGRSRFLYGQRLAPAPSPFLREIPEGLFSEIMAPDKIKKQKGPDKQMGLF